MKIKKRVDLSTYSVVMTVIGIVVLGALAYFQNEQGHEGSTFFALSVLILLCLGALIYMPMSVEVDDKELCVRRSLWFKRIPLSEIKSIELFQPTMVEKRLLGSGGWFGYWGRFSEPTIGKYFAYYGKASDCFLVTLKNYKKYVIGCRQPEEIVDFVKERI